MKKTVSSKKSVSEEVTDKIYQFDISQPNDKLMLQAKCTLIYHDTELLTTITGVEKDCLTLKCKENTPLNATAYRLVIYPWFLYEKLQLALEALQDTAQAGPFYIANAFRLFGKGGVRQDQRTPLNQNQAVQLYSHTALNPSLNSNFAFVWGPLGTGKTTTSAKNLINVSISRVCGKLIIISDIAYFQQRASQSVIADMLTRVAQTGLLAASSL